MDLQVVLSSTWYSILCFVVIQYSVLWHLEFIHLGIMFSLNLCHPCSTSIFVINLYLYTKQKLIIIQWHNISIWYTMLIFLIKRFSFRILGVFEQQLIFFKKGINFIVHHASHGYIVVSLNSGLVFRNWRVDPLIWVVIELSSLQCTILSN